MKVRRGKLVGLGAVVVGIGVLLVAGFASKRLILEEWYVSKLQSTDQETRENAAKALGEYGSVRSIPPLMKAHSDSLALITKQRGKSDPLTGIEGNNFASMLVQQERLTRAISEISRDERLKGNLPAQREIQTYLSQQRAALDTRLADLATEMATVLAVDPFFESLSEITKRAKKKAVPCLSEQLGNDDWNIRWQAARLLGLLGSDAKHAVQVLKTKSEDFNALVQYAATEALKSIGHDDEQ